MKIFFHIVFLFFSLIPLKTNAMIFEDSLKRKTAPVINWFVGGGFGVYRVPQKQVFDIPLTCNLSVKYRYEALSIWGFGQYARGKLWYGGPGDYVDINSDGLILGSGHYGEKFTFIAGAGVGAVFTKEYSSGVTIWHGSTLYSKPSYKGYSAFGLCFGFHMAFKGQLSRFALQSNFVFTNSMTVSGLLILGYEFGHR